MKNFVAGIISIIICFILGFALGWYLKDRGVVPADIREVVKIKVISKPVPGYPFSLTIRDLIYYSDSLEFIASATNSGEAQIALKRPKHWRVPEHLLTLGIGGGYYCGQRLTSGIAAFQWRLGSLEHYNFYLGPMVMVAAGPSTSEELPLATSLYLVMTSAY